MHIVDAALNVAADALAALLDYASAHSAFSRSGANEDTGGVYARTITAWNGASGAGVATLNGNVDVSVNAGTWSFAGFWSAISGGVFYSMVPVGSAGIKKGIAVAANDTVYCEAHGLVADNRVAFFGDGLPGAIVEGTLYWVISTGLTADEFKFSSTQAGAAFDITDEGFAVFSRVIPEVFGAPGILRLSGTTTKVDLGALRA